MSTIPSSQYAKFKGYRCFINEWAGFEKVCSVNVIIGRNNSGKSALLDLVEHLAQKSIFKHGYEVRLQGILKSEDLRTMFPENTSGGALSGNHWIVGRQFVDEPIEWSRKQNDVHFYWSQDLGRYSEVAIEHIKKRIKTIARGKPYPLMGKLYRRLLGQRQLHLLANDNYTYRLISR